MEVNTAALETGASLQLEPRLTLSRLFFAESPFTVSDIIDLFRDLAPKVVRKGELVVTLSNEEEDVCISVSQTFAEIRAKKATPEQARDATAAIAARITGEPALFTITGLLLQLIMLLHTGRADVSAELKSRHLMGLPDAAATLGVPSIDATSIKLYVTAKGVPYEVDVGAYLLDLSKVYIEVESRRSGISSHDDFVNAWSHDLEFVRGPVLALARSMITGVGRQS